MHINLRIVEITIQIEAWIPPDVRWWLRPVKHTIFELNSGFGSFNMMDRAYRQRSILRGIPQYGIQDPVPISFCICHHGDAYFIEATHPDCRVHTNPRTFVGLSKFISPNLEQDRS